jgi:hypothetical protein
MGLVNRVERAAEQADALAWSVARLRIHCAIPGRWALAV